MLKIFTCARETDQGLESRKVSEDKAGAAPARTIELTRPGAAPGAASHLLAHLHVRAITNLARGPAAESRGLARSRTRAPLAISGFCPRGPAQAPLKFHEADPADLYSSAACSGVFGPRPASCAGRPSLAPDLSGSRGPPHFCLHLSASPPIDGLLMYFNLL